MEKASGPVREFQRPFRPVDPSDPQTPTFALRPLADRLMAEPSFAENGHDALTLVHRPDLTVVLAVVAAGRQIDDNPRTAGPTLVVALSGSFELRREGAEPVTLAPENAATVAPEVDHVLTAKEDSTLLMVIGAQ